MKKQKPVNQHTQAGNAGNNAYPIFDVGDQVVFVKGLPRAVFGNAAKGPFVVSSEVFEDDLGEPCVKIKDKDGIQATFPISILSVVPKTKTDEDIIKGLECCLELTCCEKCPYDKDQEDSDCVRRNSIDALDLIKRQKEKIESLKSELKIIYNAGRTVCEDLKCETCFLKDSCLQLKECGTKDVDNSDHLAGCWAMFLLVTEKALLSKNKIKKNYGLFSMLNEDDENGGN